MPKFKAIPILETSLLLIFFSVGLLAQEKTIPIWNGKAPGTENRKDEETIANGSAYKIFQPDLRIFPAVTENKYHPAVLIIPGGRYTHVIIEKEGSKVAKWLNNIGICTFILKYRLDENEALEDAQLKYLTKK
jgi:acetyl esterase/lipase